MEKHLFLLSTVSGVGLAINVSLRNDSDIPSPTNAGAILRIAPSTETIKSGAIAMPAHDKPSTMCCSPRPPGSRVERARHPHSAGRHVRASAVPGPRLTSPRTRIATEDRNNKPW